MKSKRPMSKGKSGSGKGKSGSGKGKGKYEDLDIPDCPSEAPSESPVQDNGIVSTSDALCTSIMDRTVEPEGPVVQVAKLYAIVEEKPPAVDLVEVIDNIVRTIGASASGCDMELNLEGGRRILAESNTDPLILTSDKVTKMGSSGKNEKAF